MPEWLTPTRKATSLKYYSGQNDQFFLRKSKEKKQGATLYDESIQGK
jgi:hypothetical protein